MFQLKGVWIGITKDGAVGTDDQSAVENGASDLPTSMWRWLTTKHKKQGEVRLKDNGSLNVLRLLQLGSLQGFRNEIKYYLMESGEYAVRLVEAEPADKIEEAEQLHKMAYTMLSLQKTQTQRGNKTDCCTST